MSMIFRYFLLFLLAASGIGAVVQAARRLYRLPKK